MNSSTKAPADPFIMSTMVEAPAKVNLFLRMDGTREDGYHLLFSAFQTLSLCDEITVRIRPRREDEKDSAGVVIGSNSSALPKDPFKNTAFLAAYRFLEKMACREYTVQIDMIKNIPSQAGLGGGSSDAASVLAAMDTLFPGKVSREDLLKIAVSIGADVPFFLTGGTALCEGIGEIVTPLPELAGLPMLLMKPQRGVSTPACYKAFDAMGGKNITEEEKTLLKSVMTDPASPADRLRLASVYWTNDLQAPAIASVPEIEDGIRLMADGGAVFSAMSGSGSAVFGFFDQEASVDYLMDTPEFRALIRDGWWAQKAFAR